MARRPAAFARTRCSSTCTGPPRGARTTPSWRFWRRRRTGLWVGRPLALDGDPALALREWPLAQVAMAALDDPAAQADALKRLFAASRATRHELLLEASAASAIA